MTDIPCEGSDLEVVEEPTPLTGSVDFRKVIEEQICVPLRRRDPFYSRDGIGDRLRRR